jgi:hypothetical protein
MNIFTITFNLDVEEEKPELFTCPKKVANRLLEIAKEKDLYVTDVETKVLHNADEIINNLENNHGLFIDDDNTPAYARCYCVDFNEIDNAVPTSAPAKKSIRELMDQSDSISFGDDFYRHISPYDEGELEYVFDFNDERYEFTSESLDNAKLDDGCWSAYCSYNKQHIDINFYAVKDITSSI